MKYLLPLIGLSLLTSACQDGYLFKPSMFDNTHVTQRKIQIFEERHVEKMATKDLSYDYLMGLSNDYEHHGDSPMYVVIGYNPSSRNGKLSAFNKSNIIKGQLAKMDIKNAVVKTMPVNDSTSETVIAYNRIEAKGPQNCGKIPGYTTQTGEYGDYGIGCTVKDMIAQQIAYPGDLEGKSDMNSPFGGDRAAVIVNRDINAGEVNSFVPSYVLSELAGNTTE